MHGGVIQRAPRRKVLIRARMRAGGPKVDICIRDISPRGMLLQASAPPPRGTFVEIVRPDRAIVGQVIWRSERRFGVVTREIMDVAALVSTAEWASGGAALASADLPAHSVRRAGPADPAQRLERSRRLSAAAQFGFAITLGVAAALGLAGTLHEILSPTLDRIESHLRSGR